MDSVTEDNFTLVIPIELDNNSSSPKEHLKLLREINNAFLTREIYCNLNVFIFIIHLIARPLFIIRNFSQKIFNLLLSPKD